MNILFLTTKFPFPPDTGAKIRDFNLIKEISKKHSIILLSFIQEGKEKIDLKTLEPFCSKIETVKEKKSSIGVLLVNAIGSLFTKKPFTIRKYYCLEMKRKLGEILINNKIDLIHCSHLHMAQYAENLENIPRVLDEHNIEFFLIRRYLKEERNLIKKTLVFFLQYLKMGKYESTIAQRFNHCLVVSEADKKSLESIAPNVFATVISNGADLAFYSSNGGKSEPNSLVFTGMMDWFPNEDAILYFYERIWPLIKKEIDDVRLYIVGRNPSNKILGLSKKERNIIVTGYVADVRPYISKASAYIVPLRIGGGSRLKILEAMAMSKAVLSTSIGCEGLEVTDDENILISDSLEEFSGKIKILLKNSQLRDKLGINARKLVEDKYSWEIIGKELDKVYNKIINESNG